MVFVIPLKTMVLMNTVVYFELKYNVFNKRQAFFIRAQINPKYSIDAQSVNVRVLIIPFIFQVIQLEGNGKIH